MTLYYMFKHFSLYSSSSVCRGECNTRNNVYHIPYSTQTSIRRSIPMFGLSHVEGYIFFSRLHFFLSTMSPNRRLFRDPSRNSTGRTRRTFSHRTCNGRAFLIYNTCSLGKKYNLHNKWLSARSIKRMYRD